MRLCMHIALRFLKSGRGQTFLIILGIAIGVSVQIFIGSLIQGLQKDLVDKTIGNSSQITVYSRNGGLIGDYRKTGETAEASDAAVRSVSFALDNTSFMEYGGDSQSLLIRGLSLERAEGIYHLGSHMKEGSLPAGDDEIILGTDLKKEYGMNLGDKVKITTTGRKTAYCKVTGFFDLNVSSLNTGWGITTLRSAQKIFGTGDKVTSVEMQVKNDSVFQADTIAGKIKKALDRSDLKVVSWKSQNRSLLSGLQGQSISSYMIQIFVIISVILGIASVLAITVIQKSRQIGILKAMGLRNSSARGIFLLEGLILGALGTAAGICLGLGFSFAFSAFVLDSEGNPVIAFYINVPFILISGAAAVAASVLAALFPALRSSRLDPIDIIRNN